MPPPPAHFGHRLRARDQDTVVAIQRQRVTRREVVELGSIIPAGLLRSSLKAPASSAIRHVAEIVQRRVPVDLHSRELHTDPSDSRQFVRSRDVTSHFDRPQRGPQSARMHHPSHREIVRDTESPTITRDNDNCSAFPILLSDTRLQRVARDTRSQSPVSRSIERELRTAVSPLLRSPRREIVGVHDTPEKNGIRTIGKSERPRSTASVNEKTHTSLGGRRATEPGGGGLLKVASSGATLRPIDACALLRTLSPASLAPPFVCMFVVFSTHPRDDLDFVRDVIYSVKNI